MTPGHEGGGPAEARHPETESPATKQYVSVARIDRPADIPAQTRRRPHIEPEPRDAWSDGFRLGFNVGRADGYDQGRADEAAEWTAALGIARRHADLPSEEKLFRLRAEDPIQPCPTRCRKCSRCVRSRSWWSRGGRDFAGGDAEAALAGGPA